MGARKGCKKAFKEGRTPCQLTEGLHFEISHSLEVKVTLGRAGCKVKDESQGRMMISIIFRPHMPQALEHQRAPRSS